jgi:hypothetical protein
MKTNIKSKQVFIRLPQVIGTVAHTVQGEDGPVIHKDIYKSHRKFVNVTDIKGNVRSTEYVQCLFPTDKVMPAAYLQWVQRSKVETSL